MDKAIELNPTSDEAFLNKGYSLNILEKYEEAILFYDKAIELNPTNNEAFLNKRISLKNLEK